MQILVLPCVPGQAAVCGRVLSTVVLEIWKLREVLSPNPLLSPVKSGKSFFPANFAPSLRKHCRPDQLGMHAPRLSQQDKLLTEASLLGRRQGLAWWVGVGSHQSLEASAPARGTSREVFQGHCSHSSTFSWATTHLLTPMCGSPLGQATTWGPAMIPAGPNCTIAPFKSHCLSPYTGKRGDLSSRDVGWGREGSRPLSLILRSQVTGCVASLRGRVPNLPREGWGGRMTISAQGQDLVLDGSKCPLSTLPPAA